MSRSYKKTPRCGDKKDRKSKRLANKRFRRKQLTHSLQHNSYRKDYCTWNICDFEEVGTTFEQYWLSVVKSSLRWGRPPCPNREEAYQEWYRWYKRK